MDCSSRAIRPGIPTIPSVALRWHQGNICFIEQAFTQRRNKLGSLEVGRTGSAVESCTYAQVFDRIAGVERRGGRSGNQAISFTTSNNVFAGDPAQRTFFHHNPHRIIDGAAF